MEKIFLAGFNKEELLDLKNSFKYKSVKFFIKKNDFFDCKAFISKNRLSFNDYIKNIKKKNLLAKWIHLPFAGLEDYKYLKNFKKITFTSCKFIQGPQVADHAISMLLALTRNLNLILKYGTNVKFDRRPIELKNKKVLIIGFGGIGKSILTRITGFNTKNFVVSNRKEKKDKNVDKFFLSKKLNISSKNIDIVFVAIPEKRENIKIINNKFIKNLNDNAIIINVSRSGILCKKDVLKNLNNKKLYGIGLDLLHKEEFKKFKEFKEFKEFKNVILTPHIAGISDQYQSRHLSLIKKNISKFLSKEKMLSKLDNTSF